MDTEQDHTKVNLPDPTASLSPSSIFIGEEEFEVDKEKDVANAGVNGEKALKILEESAKDDVFKETETDV